MNDRPPSDIPSVELSNWLGLYSNASPHRLGDKYMAAQENVTSTVAGQGQVRAGLVTVVFAEQSDAP